jgi:hypothetical protein
MRKSQLLPIPFLLLLMLCSVPVSAKQGTGVLYVYTDTWGGTEAPKEPPQGNYLVFRGQTIYIRIWNVTEVLARELVTIKIGWTDTNGNSQTTFFYNVPVLEDEQSGVRYIDVPAWTTPSNAKICTTSTVHYRYGNDEYVAAGQMSNIGHMHFVVPEVPFGPITSIAATILALYAYMRIKRV